MEDINQRLKAIRRATASKSRISLFPFSEESLTMPDYNSKVDLRPRSMINDDQPRVGKPPVDAVLHPDQRRVGIPSKMLNFSVEDLQGVKLRKTGKRETPEDDVTESTPDSMLSTVDTQRPERNEIPESYDSNQGNEVVTHSIHTPLRIEMPIPPPPPPPPQVALNIVDPVTQKLTRQLKELKLATQARNEQAKLIKQIEEAKLLLEADGLQTATPLPRPAIKPTTQQSQEVVDNRQVQEETQRLNESSLKNRNFRKWANDLADDKFERASRFEEDAPPKRRQSSRSRSRGRQNSRDDVKRPRSKSRKRSPTKSIHSTTSRAESFRSFRSAAKSVKSVIFKGTEEQELISEIDEDDIANRDYGEVGFVNHTSQKFEVHGPFIDTELNVFHAICREYELAAKVSFAKRGPFSRTNPAHDRVYALIGSNRRSSWTNRGDWNKVQNDIQILDYLFSRIIRSKSQVIRKPVMELEYFSEGSLLDPRRFWKIMKAIYYKRDRLLDVLDINITKFESIK